MTTTNRRRVACPRRSDSICKRRKNTRKRRGGKSLQKSKGKNNVKARPRQTQRSTRRRRKGCPRGTNSNMTKSRWTITMKRITSEIVKNDLNHTQKTTGKKSLRRKMSKTKRQQIHLSTKGSKK